jgi:hypothetical protein
MINCTHCNTPFQKNPKYSGYMANSVNWACFKCFNYSDPTSFCSTAHVIPNLEVLNNQVVFYYLPWYVKDRLNCLRGDSVGELTAVLDVTDQTDYIVVYQGSYFQPPIDNILPLLFKFFNKIQNLKVFA